MKLTKEDEEDIRQELELIELELGRKLTVKEWRWRRLDIIRRMEQKFDREQSLEDSFVDGNFSADYDTIFEKVAAFQLLRGRAYDLALLLIDNWRPRDACDKLNMGRGEFNLCISRMQAQYGQFLIR
jgi:hypothetical protein